MKIFALAVLKDEIDIIEEFLTATETWAEKIILLDNGSTDGTWEYINKYKSEKVIIWKQTTKVFSDALRGDLFRQFRYLACDGDWWCIRTDIDEFYLDNPVDFLSNVPKLYTVVKKKSLEYCLTKSDINNIDFNGRFSDYKDKLKHVKPFMWSEVRFIRETSSLHWEEGKNSPVVKGLEYKKMILCEHYQSRSREQLISRFNSRLEVNKNNKKDVFGHVSGESWEELLWDQKSVINIDEIDNLNNIPIKQQRFNFMKLLVVKTLKLLGIRSR